MDMDVDVDVDVDVDGMGWMEPQYVVIHQASSSSPNILEA